MISVRKAIPSDCEEIVHFQEEMAWHTENITLDHETVLKGVRAVLADQALGIYYIAETEGKIAGALLTTYEWSDWRNGTVLWIQSVYVDISHRHKGIYKALYNHVQTIVAEDETLKGIRLYVDETNHTAQKVYANLGMNGEHYRVFEWMK
jgi:ribosomal protein S18 acetylase RimI-like enzyme